MSQTRWSPWWEDDPRGVAAHAVLRPLLRCQLLELPRYSVAHRQLMMRFAHPCTVPTVGEFSNAVMDLIEELNIAHDAGTTDNERLDTAAGWLGMAETRALRFLADLDGREDAE